MKLKKIFSKISLHLLAFTIACWVITVFAITMPTLIPPWESNVDWYYKEYFNKILVNSNISTTDWIVKKSSTLINQDCWSWNLLQWFTSTWNKICIATPVSQSTYPWCDSKDIVLSNWQIWASCNIWSSIAWTWTSSYWDLFQWWRNISFPISWAITTVTWPLTAAAAASTVNYIINWNAPNDWLTPKNDNLWWWSWTTELVWTYQSVSSSNQVLMQWPCKSWYHVPTLKEWCDAITTINPSLACNTSSFQNDTLVASTLKISLAWSRDANPWQSNATIWFLGGYLTSTPYINYGRFILFSSSQIITLTNTWYRAWWTSVRCLKNP